MTPNERLRVLRKHLKLTQKDFAKKLCVTQSLITGMETGYRQLTPRMMHTLWTEFKVSREWLETGEGEMFEQFSPDEEFLQIMTEIQLSDDPIIRHIIKAYWQLSDSDKLVVQRMVKNFVDELQKDKS